ALDLLWLDLRVLPAPADLPSRLRVGAVPHGLARQVLGQRRDRGRGCPGGAGEEVPRSGSAQGPQRGGERMRNLLLLALLGAACSLVATQMALRPPPNLHELRNVGPGHVFQVVTEGYGLMPSYAAQLTPHERWAVVAYLLALRRSQKATLADAPPDIQQKLRAEAG